MKRILVTGGAGFLGSHLCEKLLQAGHDVLSADNYFTGRKSNIAHLLANPNFEVMRHDITFPLYVEVNEIYNLACSASSIHYQFDPVQTNKTIAYFDTLLSQQARAGKNAKAVRLIKSVPSSGKTELQPAKGSQKS